MNYIFRNIHPEITNDGNNILKFKNLLVAILFV